MAELKTKPTGKSVTAFLNSMDGDRRKDCRAIMAIMRRATGAKPRMWGSSVIGFGTHHYKYASGREGDWFVTGLAPRKDNLTVYLWPGTGTAELVPRLGKCRSGKGCLYIRRVADIDLAVLEQLVKRSVAGIGAQES